MLEEVLGWRILVMLQYDVMNGKILDLYYGSGAKLKLTEVIMSFIFFEMRKKSERQNTDFSHPA